MDGEQIMNSDFFKQFILEYIGNKVSSFYDDRDRLLYLLCDTEEEKEIVTKQQIQIIKETIIKCGYADFSCGYIASTIVGHHEFMDQPERNNFWIQRFVDEIQMNVWSSSYIQELYYLFDLSSETDYSELCCQDNFNAWFKKVNRKSYVRPEVMLPELRILMMMERDLKAFSRNGYWHFSFSTYEQYKDKVNTIKMLFDLSDLFVQLQRLDTFKSFIPLSTEQINERNSYLNQHWFKVGLKFADGTIQALLASNNDNSSKTCDVLQLNKGACRPYISETWNGTKRNDKNIYKSRNKMEAIYKHCMEKGLPLCEHFVMAHSVFSK